MLTLVKGHNPVTNVGKSDVQNLDLISINAYTKFGKILSKY